MLHEPRDSMLSSWPPRKPTREGVIRPADTLMAMLHTSQDFTFLRCRGHENRNRVNVGSTKHTATLLRIFCCQHANRICGLGTAVVSVWMNTMYCHPHILSSPSTTIPVYCHPHLLPPPSTTAIPVYYCHPRLLPSPYTVIPVYCHPSLLVHCYSLVCYMYEEALPYSKHLSVYEIIEDKDERRVPP